MTLEKALRLTNRNMIVFDLLLGSAATDASTCSGVSLRAVSSRFE